MTSCEGRFVLAECHCESTVPSPEQYLHTRKESRGQGVPSMRVMQIGLGPIGCAVSRLLIQKPGWHIVAAVDADLAKQHVVSVLGTGINPGFIMDTLVLVLTGACQHITRIAVTRVANASGARPSLQKKLG